jgi:hypothetical protein
MGMGWIWWEEGRICRRSGGSRGGIEIALRAWVVGPGKDEGKESFSTKWHVESIKKHPLYAKSGERALFTSLTSNKTATHCDPHTV